MKGGSGEVVEEGRWSGGEEKGERCREGGCEVGEGRKINYRHL